MPARHVCLAIAAMVVVTACATSSGTSIPSATSASSTTEPSAAPSVDATVPATTPASSPSSSATGGLCAVEFERCPIAAGTYSTDAFLVPFTFAIEGSDWVNDRNWPHGGAVTKAESDSFLWAAGVAEG
jgi:hypothetical protein